MQSKSGLPVAGLPTGRHAMRVGDRRDVDSPRRNRRVVLHKAGRGRNDAGAPGRSTRRRRRWGARSGGTPGEDVDDRRLGEVGSRGRLGCRRRRGSLYRGCRRHLGASRGRYRHLWCSGCRGCLHRWRRRPLGGSGGHHGCWRSSRRPRRWRPGRKPR